MEFFLSLQAAWMLSSWSTLWKIGHITFIGQKRCRRVVRGQLLVLNMMDRFSEFWPTLRETIG